MKLKDIYFEDKRVRDIVWEIDDLCWKLFMLRFFDPDEQARLTILGDRRNAKLWELKSLLQGDADDLDLLQEVFDIIHALIRTEI